MKKNSQDVKVLSNKLDWIATIVCYWFMYGDYLATCVCHESIWIMPNYMAYAMLSTHAPTQSLPTLLICTYLNNLPIL
jgi:hypothetical protein